MWAPALRPDDVEAERTVILDEILMHADEPADLAGERWQAALFPDHALGRDTLGTASSVQRITRDDIRAFFDLHYRPANMVVSVAGDCTHDAVAAELERALRRRRRAAPRRARARRPDPTPSPLDVVRRSTEQAHLVYGMRSRLALRRAALGPRRPEPRAGRRAVEPPLPEGARAARPGLLGVVGAGGLPGQRVAGRGGRARRPNTSTRCCASSSAELELLAAEGITDRELAVAKGNLRAEMLLSGEDSGARMSRLGASLLLHGEVLSVDEVLARIDGIERARRPGRGGGVGPGAAHAERGGPLRRAATSSPTGPPWPPGSLGPCRPRSLHRVGVVGAGGRMGQEVCRAVTEARRPGAGGRRRPRPCRGRRLRPHDRRRGQRAVATSAPRSWSTSPSPRRCATTCRTTPSQGIHAVIGTSGLSDDDLADMAPPLRQGSGANVVVVPNFAIGAVLLAAPLPHRRPAHGRRRGHRAAPRRQARRALGHRHAHGGRHRGGPRAPPGSGPLPPDPTTDVVLAGARGADGRRRRARALGAAARAWWRTRRSSSARRARA